MPLFCKNCNRELKFVTMMRAHVNECFKAGKDLGQYAGMWDAALKSPLLMAETYFENHVYVSAVDDSQGQKARLIIAAALQSGAVGPT